MKPRAHVRIDFSGTVSLGPGKVGLLEAIARTGSLSSAARELGMSYRRGWLLLHSVNSGFREPVVVLSVGGAEGGGAQLTAFGRTLIATYRQLLSDVDALAAKSMSDLVGEAPGAVPAAPVPRRPVSRSLKGAGRRVSRRRSASP